MTVHIHAPQPTWVHRRARHCKQCKRRRVHAVYCYEWYDPDWRCTSCGRDPVRAYVAKRVNYQSRKKAREALGMKP